MRFRRFWRRRLAQALALGAGVLVAGVESASANGGRTSGFHPGAQAHATGTGGSGSDTWTSVGLGLAVVLVIALAAVISILVTRRESGAFSA